MRAEGDKVVEQFDWFNRHGIILGWSPKAGKVAVMRLRQDSGLPPEQQVEFSFYIGDIHLKSVTTAELVAVGAMVETDHMAVEEGFSSPGGRSVNQLPQRARYMVEGCKQVANTNDYYYLVRLNETKVLFFDITTGELCRLDSEGTAERLIPANNSSAVRPE